MRSTEKGNMDTTAGNMKHRPATRVQYDHGRLHMAYG